MDSGLAAQSRHRNSRVSCNGATALPNPSCLTTALYVAPCLLRSPALFLSHARFCPTCKHLLPTIYSRRQCNESYDMRWRQVIWSCKFPLNVPVKELISKIDQFLSNLRRNMFAYCLDRLAHIYIHCREKYCHYILTRTCPAFESVEFSRNGQRSSQAAQSICCNAVV